MKTNYYVNDKGERGYTIHQNGDKVLEQPLKKMQKVEKEKSKSYLDESIEELKAFITLMESKKYPLKELYFDIQYELDNEHTICMDFMGDISINREETIEVQESTILVNSLEDLEYEISQINEF